MRRKVRPEMGALWMASAIGLAVVSMLVPYAWGALLPSTVPAGQESFYLGLHTTWIPLSGVVLLAASAVLLGAGFLLVWRERTRFDPQRHVLFRRGGLAFSGVLVAAVLRTALGLIVGFVYAPELLLPLHVVDVILASVLGLTFYWLLLGMGVGQARLAGIVALAAGSGSSLLVLIASATHATDVDAIAVALGFLSLTLWLALFLWGYDELRLRGDSRPPALPA